MKIDAIPIKEVRINEHALKNIQFHPTLINFFYGKKREWKNIDRQTSEGPQPKR